MVCFLCFASFRFFIRHMIRNALIMFINSIGTLLNETFDLFRLPTRHSPLFAACDAYGVDDSLFMFAPQYVREFL